MISKKRGKLVIVLCLLLVLFSSLIYAAENGCYTYPEAKAGVTYCVPNLNKQEAIDDCNEHPGCLDVDYYFTPNSDCDVSDFPECEVIICDIDCDPNGLPLGLCEYQGGGEVEDELYDSVCSDGCCIQSHPEIGTLCQFPMKMKQCELDAQKKGLDAPDFNNEFGMDLFSCQQQCYVEVEEAIIQGTIADLEGVPIVSATVKLLGTDVTTLTDENGFYKFPHLLPGLYLVSSSAEEFLSDKTETFSLSAGETITKDLYLTPLEGVITVTGFVTDSATGEVLPGVSVYFPDLLEEIPAIETNEDGYYTIINVPAGTYELIATILEYAPGKEEITLVPGIIKNFALNKKIISKIKGVTYVDFNKDEVNNQPPSSVSIYIDDVYRGTSDNDGTFEISVDVNEDDEQHEIRASYLSSYKSEEIPFTLSPGEEKSIDDLFLLSHMGECSYFGDDPDKPVDPNTFLLEHVKGENKVIIRWGIPCPEVSGFVIDKINEDTGGIVWDEKAFSPNEFIGIIDVDTPQNEVKWNTNYKYRIWAIYTDGPDDNSIRYSREPAEKEIFIGDQECEGIYEEEQSFCLVERRDERLGCDSENILFVAEDCKSEGGQFFCSQESPLEADCLPIGPCKEFGTPFGLYYGRDQCYGENFKNFCTYDYTSEVVDQCLSCIEIENCFQYQSKDACEVNNCLSETCQWIDASANENLINYFDEENNLILSADSEIPLLVSSETGAGYCVEEGYRTTADEAADEFCSFCSSNIDNNLFENYYCTAEVCTGLGRCFSEQGLEECNTCGKTPTENANCHRYKTELECVGDSLGTQVTQEPYGLVTESDDVCNWGRCIWTGVSCVKDSNFDNQAECLNIDAAKKCQQDNSPPQTKIVPKGLPIVSLAHPEITFFGDDFSPHEYAKQQNPLSEVYYCLTSTVAQAADACTFDKFSIAEYVGVKTKENKQVNLIEYPYLDKTKDEGQTFKIKFFSVDKYSNQEEVKESFVFIDNVLPDFEIQEEVSTIADTTDLTVILSNINEPMSCKFDLLQMKPVGEKSTEYVSHLEEIKQIEFTGLNGIHYSINVTCTDSHGNVKSKSKDKFLSLDQDVHLIYPALEQYVSTVNIPFKITTDVGSTCELYRTKTNEKITDFITDEEGKVHETLPVPVSKDDGNEGEYAGEYRVVCTELLSKEVHDLIYFHFFVDLTSPETTIILTEKDRVESPSLFGWSKNFFEEVQVSFECYGDGIECDQTYYCLGPGCGYPDAPGYTEFTSVLLLEDSTEICYYSTDLAQNFPKIICGEILIEGYGLVLDNPPQYYYEGEKWGISSEPNFDWKFHTKVPSQECRFDFFPNFDYDNVEYFKILQNEGGFYTFPNFPGEVMQPFKEEGNVKTLYVKCIDADLQQGPEEKINLEYDPSKPVVEEAYADPGLVLEGLTTDLHVRTDDKTICKYSDNSDGLGSADFVTMPYTFPGGLDKKLSTTHSDNFALYFFGTIKNYSLNVICKNGAEVESDLKELNFIVDYTDAGNILSVYPNGDYISAVNVSLIVNTSKNAVCEYEFGNQSYPLVSDDAKTHTGELFNLDEKLYSVPVSCMLGETPRNQMISFTIDLTKPVIENVTDYERTCGSEFHNVYVYTEDDVIGTYYYELYDEGIKSDDSIPYAASEKPIHNDTAYNQPLKIPVAQLNLTEGHEYSLRIWIYDKAGNEAGPIYSDGFVHTLATELECLLDKEAPVVDIKIEPECTYSYVEIHCSDENSCGDIFYGTSTSSDSCVADTIYGSGKIEFTEPSYLCYTATDAKGQNSSKIELISFVDTDGDGTNDVCDQCPSTTPGMIVNLENGCSLGQLTEEEKKRDNDFDGLPDYWELINNQVGCEFDHLSDDSDGDGLQDSSEDYDEDGRTNYQEFLDQTDPCVKDEPKEKAIEIDEEQPIQIFDEEEENLLAWIFLLIGFLLFIGGLSYMIYFYIANKGKLSAAGVRPGKIKPMKLSGFKLRKPKMFGKLVQLRRGKRDRLKEKRKRDLFGGFGKKSETIPHLEKALSKPNRNSLHHLAKDYQEHKKEIQPGLRHGEKGIFAKLDNIAEQTKQKKIHQVVSKTDAEDIFNKLKKISKKRKGK